MLDDMIVVGIPFVILSVILVLGMTFWARYRTAGPDEAMIITGSFLVGGSVITDESNRRIKIVRGGGAFILPIFQRIGRLPLSSHKLDVSTPEVYTGQGVPVMADGVAIIKVGSMVEDIATAAEQFMGKSQDAIRLEACEVLEGHLRAILGTMTVEEIYRNRDRFAQEVQEVAARDLKKMGLQIVSFTIKDVRDKQGYLEALGKPQIAAVKRDADIAEAEAVRDARIKKAQAEEVGQKAELLRDTNVAEATKEKELKVATFKTEQDMARAIADQAYNIQKARSEQTVTEEQMKIEIVRKDREIDLQKKEVQRQEQEYNAQVRKKAEADRYSIEQAAEAEKAKQLLEADALQYRIEAEAKGQAEQKRLEGTAEAEIIRLKGTAEAEAKEKLAEAFKKYGHAAVLDIIAKMLPELAGRVAEPLKSIDKLTVVDAGGVEGAVRVSNYVTALMATAPEMLKNISGLDIEALIKGLVMGTPPAPQEDEKTDESGRGNSDVW
ncbi:flotillin-related [Holotrichia oblita]|nr:flotillin-related [Holotrichia oblita]